MDLQELIKDLELLARSIRNAISKLDDVVDAIYQTLEELRSLEQKGD